MKLIKFHWIDTQIQGESNSMISTDFPKSITPTLIDEDGVGYFVTEVGLNLQVGNWTEKTFNWITKHHLTLNLITIRTHRFHNR